MFTVHTRNCGTGVLENPGPPPSSRRAELAACAYALAARRPQHGAHSRGLGLPGPPLGGPRGAPYSRAGSVFTIACTNGTGSMPRMNSEARRLAPERFVDCVSSDAALSLMECDRAACLRSVDGGVDLLRLQARLAQFVLPPAYQVVFSEAGARAQS